MQNIIEDILHERRTDAATFPLRTGLRILEIIYSSIITVRNYFYDKKIFRTHDIRCRVISIGNLTIGGTGKTPVVIMTAKIMYDAGYRVAVISRGYKGSAHAPMVISDGSDITVSATDSGDEPYIIAQSLPGIPVIVGKDRFRAAQLASMRFKPDIIILDDAFQHRRLYRDVDIVTIDAGHPFGNKHLLPRGTLRESPHALKRACAVIITRFNKTSTHGNIEKTVRQFNSDLSVFHSIHEPSGLRKPGGKDRIDYEVIRGKNIAAMSNIANPDSFHRMLESFGTTIVKKHVFPDHHRYNINELQEIEKSSLAAGSELLVMTAKDEQNLPENLNVELIDRLVLDIKAILIDRQEEYYKITKPEF